MLAFIDFSDRVEGEPKFKDAIYYSEIIFTIIYTVESILKIIAQGLLLGQGTYLKNGWNILDLAVVIAGIWGIIFPGVSLGFMSLVRMSKPIKGLLQVSKTRIILKTLFQSLKNLKGSLFFLLVFVLVYSMIGVSIFRGAMETRCRTTVTPPANVATEGWPIYQDIHTKPHICGYKRCPDTSYCKNAAAFNLTYDKHATEIKEFNYGYTNFNNVAWGMLTMFEIWTGEGWVNILYIYWNSLHPILAMLYFNSSIFFATIFMMNMVLGVINSTFEKVTREDKITEEKVKENMRNIALNARGTVGRGTQFNRFATQGVPNKITGARDKPGAIRNGQLDANGNQVVVLQRLEFRQKSPALKSKNTVQVPEETPNLKFGDMLPQTQEEDVSNVGISELNSSEDDTTSSSNEGGKNSVQNSDDKSPREEVHMWALLKRGMEKVGDDRRGIGKSPRVSNKKKAQDLTNRNEVCLGKETEIMTSKRAGGKIMPLRSGSFQKSVLGANMRGGGTVKFQDDSQLDESHDGRADCNISSTSTAKQIRTRLGDSRGPGGGGSRNTSFGEDSEFGRTSSYGLKKDWRVKASPTIKTDISNISEQFSKEGQDSREGQDSKSLQNGPDPDSSQDNTNLDNTNLENTILHGENLDNTNLDNTMTRGTNLENTTLHNDSTASMVGRIKPGISEGILSPRQNLSKPSLIAQSHHPALNLPEINRSQAPAPPKYGLLKKFTNLLIDPLGEEADPYNIDVMIPFLSLRGKENACLRFFIKIALSETFNVFRITFTLANLVIMCSDKYPNHIGTSLQILTLIDFLITLFFFMEMIILNIALSLCVYLRDPFNAIDGFIASSSVLEVVLAFVDGRSLDNMSTAGVFAVFRIFRTFRIFKLINNWKSLRILLTTAVKVIKDMRYFVVILLVYLCVASLLGMQLFAYRMRFYEGDGGPFEVGVGDIKNTVSPRLNFDNFYNSFTSNFVILAQDNWINILHDACRCMNPVIPVIFCIITVVFGNIILLNLFLAILLQNFSDASNANKKSEKKIFIMILGRVGTKFKNFFLNTVFKSC
jgi:hypothetical protein